jgi:hypothetical protein
LTYFTFPTKVPLRFVTYLPKVAKIFVGPVTSSSLGHALYKDKKIFFTIWMPWVSKDAEFYGDCKNLNLPL